MTITVSAKVNDPKEIVEVKPEIVSDVWIRASWEEFLALAEEPSLDKAKFYYDQHLMRIEMSPVGPIHAHENGVVYKVISVFAAFAGICIYEYLNCSFRKTGNAEFQPDMVFYIGTDLKIPPRNNAPVDLDKFDLPTLVVEISATTIQEDLGYKRLLYERLGIQEYWAVNASTSEIFAFAIADGHSGRITQSQVLKGLDISKVEEALHLSYAQNDGEITKWIFQTFAKPATES
ncbi:MAG: Uma2 family endonuclease [Pseudanabaena sp.]